MNKYAQTAMIAAKKVKSGMAPDAAWEMASCEVFKKEAPHRKRDVQRMLFLGYMGLILIVKMPSMHKEPFTI